MDRLSALAHDVTVKPKRPVHLYFRSIENMFREAAAYERHGDAQRAFVLYLRLVILVLEKLPRHPEYMQTQYASVRPKVRKIAADAMTRGEALKQKCQDICAREAAAAAAQVEAKRQLDEEQARKEQTRLAAEAEQKAFNTDVEAPALVQEQDYAGLHDTELAAAHKLEKRAPSSAEPILPPYNQALYMPSMGDLAASLPQDVNAPQALPLERLLSPSLPESKPVIPSRPVPSAPRLEADWTSERMPGMRTIYISPTLVPQFLDAAAANSVQNIETCGVLAGKLEGHAFRLTTVILPKQKGTSDSCDTLDEMELFDHVDRQGLLVLGWIHTHPSQTSFMSSVDLHTHCSYQLMLPEAIAIVCSVKYQETKVFSLTAPHGLSYIADCRLPGFHPHTENPPIYEVSMHCQFQDYPSFELVDFRR